MAMDTGGLQSSWKYQAPEYHELVQGSKPSNLDKLTAQLAQSGEPVITNLSYVGWFLIHPGFGIRN